MIAPPCCVAQYVCKAACKIQIEVFGCPWPGYQSRTRSQKYRFRRDWLIDDFVQDGCDHPPRNSARNSRRIGLLIRKVQPPPRKKHNTPEFKGIGAVKVKLKLSYGKSKEI